MFYCHCGQDDEEVRPHKFKPCRIPGLCMYWEDRTCHIKMCIADESDSIHIKDEETKA